MQLSRQGVRYSSLAAAAVLLLLLILEFTLRESLAWSAVVAVVAYVGADSGHVADRL